VRIVSVDDHPVARYGARRILEECPGLSIDQAAQVEQTNQKILKELRDSVLEHAWQERAGAFAVASDKRLRNASSRVFLLSETDKSLQYR
jgi:DNA-binding NarL/FixJ family response regulator